jgi:Tfp pilus assembly protein PilE
MCSKTIPVSRLGLTLVEVLGATAVLVTLATISVVSIRDSVQAGQKATLQREVQQLNTALEEYKSAGGVIPEDTAVEDVLTLLKDGVDLAGDGDKDYASLVTDPPLQMQVAGETYDLTYTPQEGFAYTNANGEGIGGSGQSSTLGSEPLISNDTVPNMISQLQGYAPGSPAYNNLTGQLALAMSSDTISPETKQSITDAMLEQGYVYNSDTLAWEGITTGETAQPGTSIPTTANTNYKFDISNPAAVQGAMDSLPSLRAWNDQDPSKDPRDYSQTIASLLAASQQGHENYTPEGVRSFVDAELDAMMDAIRAARASYVDGQLVYNPQQWASLVNSLVKVLEVDGYYSGRVADFLVGQRMGNSIHTGLTEDFKVDNVDWTIETPNQTPPSLYQPTGANANISPVLGRVFKLESADNLTALFGTPETSGIVGGDSPRDAQHVIAMINNQHAHTYYWNNNLNRWTRVSLGSPDATDYSFAPGTTIVLKQPSGGF